jgi:hypothetical protein
MRDTVDMMIHYQTTAQNFAFSPKKPVRRALGASTLDDACRLSSSPEVGSDFSLDAQGVTHYDSRSDRAFTSPLSCRTISVVLRMSPSLRPTPMVDAIARNRALSSR